MLHRYRDDHYHIHANRICERNDHYRISAKKWSGFGLTYRTGSAGPADISNTEKLVYLRHSLKDGSAKNVIEGLSHSGDQYEEAIDTIKARYDRPQVIHQTHVRKIYEMPSLMDGSGKELRRFHDTAKQHLRALKAMKKDPNGLSSQLC